jgi:CRISPR/Cas system-associated exonuclease Cas4 (RecB family)
MIRQGTNILKEHSQKRLDFKPELKQVNFLDRRVYMRSEGVYYPSVTSILQYMPKNKFFDNWLKDVGHNADLILAKAGKEGTQVHEAAEALIKGEEVTWMDEFGNAKYSQLVWEMILKFYDFWSTHKPELLFAEEFTYSDKYQYAGTADLLVKMDGEIWLLDIKTSNSLHRAYDMQLAAYAKSIEEAKGIKVDRTGIIWLKAATRSSSDKKGVYQGKGWQIKVIDEIEKNFDLFMTVYKLYKLDNPETKPIFREYPTVLKL